MTENRKVLFVDDDVHILSSVRRTLRGVVDLVLADGPKNALEKMRQGGPFAVVVSDQNMPGMDGIRLLSLIARKNPATIRVMLTGDGNPKTAVNAVNNGSIFRFITKPCNSDTLIKTIEDSLKRHQELVGERELLEQSLSASIKVLVEVLAVSRPLAHERATLMHRWARKVGKVVASDASLEISVSGMLSSLGCLTLPDFVADRYLSGDDLSGDERELVTSALSQASDLLRPIPRMEGVAEAIKYCRKGFDGSGFPNDEIAGDALPEAARILCPLIDLAEVSAGQKPVFRDCLALLEPKMARYDPLIWEAICGVLGGDERFSAGLGSARHKVGVDHLTPGDTLAREIRDPSGRLLLAAGNQISAVTLKRLKMLNSISASDLEFEIWRDVDAPLNTVPQRAVG
ncbi:response regulator receiver modulated metal-depenent phosphohydrolase [Roseibium aquae]|uniref:Response regulator receiver modulated metal-depenent phosphohydrolase n=1 Tax=Roseibium aquae TaxID=1323746 RepID=A0A916X1X3_9HYPH|nr:HD domain-containing phosphohydrolase [Roseibium aquae]GGB49508.1 response regulator receiver modulated metal-depenent phosphohydrolase [Roseibium aquae]